MTQRRRKVVVLVSGGVDSVTALYAAGAEWQVVAALSFRYGAKHEARELPFAAWHTGHVAVRHLVVDLPFVAEHFHSNLLAGGAEIPRGHYEEETMRRTVVPFRNGIFLSIAAGFAESNGADGLVIAAHTGDHAIYPDCREGFMQSMADAIRLGTYAKTSLLRPFIGWTKAEIVARGAALGIDYARTWSCYVGGERHCGECGTCVERREAFQLAGVADPTDYVSLAPLPARPVAGA
jgi:7-cyano-7-deazaguanine synthase